VYQAVFQDSGFQHPGNQAKNSLVSYPLLEELQQPRVIHSIEKATYIGFDDVVNTLLLDGLSQRIKAVMGAPSGTITVATVFEHRLENGFQHTLRGQFHYLIFEATDPQWAPLLTAWLRNVTPSLCLWTISHPSQTGRQIL
jgi:hypothetical protein